MPLILMSDALPWTDGILIRDPYVDAIPALHTLVPTTFAPYFLLLVLKPQSDVPSLLLIFFFPYLVFSQVS